MLIMLGTAFLNIWRISHTAPWVRVTLFINLKKTTNILQVIMQQGTFVWYTKSFAKLYTEYTLHMHLMAEMLLKQV